MTKLKSKKMSKSTFAIIIMAIAMVAMLAFGGTYAWFTSSTITATSDATTQMGKIVLTASGDALSSTSLTADVLPGEPVFAEDAAFSIKDNSNRASFIFIKISATITLAAEGSEAEPLELNVEDLNANEAAGILKPLSGEAGVYYIETTETASQATSVGETYTISGFQASIANNEENNEYQLATIELVVKVQAIQQYGFEGAADAYTNVKAALNA